MSTKWRYDEPTPDGNRQVTKTEQEILDYYWEFWKNRMQELGRDHLISKENCIQDWITVNWAYKVEE
jgi:hypothetical protein